jgi:hypothetical protein
MAKVILEFDAVEDQDDIRSALDGYKWKLAVWDIDQKLRETTKHGMSAIKRNEAASEIECEVAEKYRAIIREILDDYNLNMD